MSALSPQFCIHVATNYMTSMADNGVEVSEVSAGQFSSFVADKRSDALTSRSFDRPPALCDLPNRQAGVFMARAFAVRAADLRR